MQYLAGLLFALIAGAALAQTADYAGSENCIACHPDQAALWEGSHHRAAWTTATPDNIRADFDGTAFTLGDMHVAFRIAPDGTRRAAVTETDGVTTEYPVHSVVGIEPLQQYLFETEPGRLQSFDVVWDTERGGWFHLYPDQNPPPSDALHWSGPYKTWNARCAVCHATGYVAGYDPATRSYTSTQAEIGVGCEACHGPGRAHADNPAKPLVDTSSFLVTCGGCHSRREAFFDSTPPPGTPYHDAYALALLRPGLYWPDGQIRDEVYVTGSFLQSKMYARGVTCSNCHDPHSGARIAEGNALCAQCHSPAGNPDFPTLTRADYDTPGHHRHAADTACMSCHMPEQVYMGNDARADHSFRVPRPDLAAATGAPDACTACHADQRPDWAAAMLEDWYPDSRHRGPHYGTVLAGDGTGLAPLALSDAPGIVRATALWMLGREGQEADAVAPALADPDPLVRAAAVGAQRGADPTTRVQRLVGLLDDPARTVRIAAARAILGAPVAHLPPAMAANLRQAQSEWRAALAARLDFPETHLQLGGMALTLRNFPAAARAFAEVTALDPQHIDAWVMQARLAAAMDDPAAARQILDDALAANPGDPALATLLGAIDGTPPRLLPPD